jgi:hypothetical protein
MVMTKLIINQDSTGFFTVSGNQFYNIAPMVITDEDGNEAERRYSIGIENTSFAVYRDEAKARKELHCLLKFMTGSSGKQTYQFSPDKE